MVESPVIYTSQTVLSTYRTILKQIQPDSTKTNTDIYNVSLLENKFTTRYMYRIIATECFLKPLLHIKPN